MPLYDFECACGNTDECICSMDTKTQECPKCQGLMHRVFTNKCATVLTTIIPSYPGSKKMAAGYVHSHADRPATKVQSGYGGSQSPKG